MENILGLMIPIMALSIPFFAIWIKHKERIAQLGIDSGALQSGDAARIAQLEDRVRVLERIVTDGGYSVAAEIEALRTPAADAGVPLNLPKKEHA